MMVSSVCATTACFTRYRFTVKERDAESGNDYFGARYYASSMGRMMSPDPSGIAAVDPTNPQSWNMYSYALNNPLILVDPTGLDPCPPVLAYGDSGDSGGGGASDDGGCDNMTPPPMPPDQNCSGSDCGTDPKSDADSMGIILGILNKPCLTAALRAVVASGETPGQPDDGYGTVVGGTVISAPAPFTDLIGTRNAHIDDPSSLSGHPNILVQVNKNLRSTAFGRYQILHGSAQGQHMTDFSPAGQDAYANNLLNSRGALNAAAGGNFAGSMADAGKEWASMPGSPYGQGGISLGAAAKTFLGAISSAQECQ